MYHSWPTSFINKLNFNGHNEALLANHRKILVGLTEDVRILFIKLADRLHNMRTLYAIPEDRQRVKAHEALDILAPIAHHLGIHKIKSELEDTCLYYLENEKFIIENYYFSTKQTYMCISKKE